jgi:hypothetical protein
MHTISLMRARYPPLRPYWRQSSSCDALDRSGPAEGRPGAARSEAAVAKSLNPKSLNPITLNPYHSITPWAPRAGVRAAAHGARRRAVEAPPQLEPAPPAGRRCREAGCAPQTRQ